MSNYLKIEGSSGINPEGPFYETDQKYIEEDLENYSKSKQKTVDISPDKSDKWYTIISEGDMPL